MSREIVEKALGEAMTARIWTGNYLPVFGCTPQAFSVAALLPAIMYMFRWGHRRGKGKFLETYIDREIGKSVTVKSVAMNLANSKMLEGFNGRTEGAILGDMLLSSTIENARRAEGHAARVIRWFAPHYSASWVDLPDNIGHLRGVPELIVNLIANQNDTEVVRTFEEGSRFPVGSKIEDNIFLKSHANGIKLSGDYKTSKTSDIFDEKVELGIDQLLVLRLAQGCGGAPSKATGKDNPSAIPNQRPIASVSAEQFRIDIINFFNCYSEKIPKQAFLPLIECCFSIGLTSIILSIIGIVEKWEHQYVIPCKEEQIPQNIFVDCSVSEDKNLRFLSEQSSELIRRRLSRLPSLIMQMRLLQEYVRKNHQF